MDEHTTCVIDGCAQIASCKAMCRLHYRRAWREGRFRKRRLPIVCFVVDCDRIAKGGGMCPPHARWTYQRHRLRTDPAFREYRLGYVMRGIKAKPERHAAGVTKSKRVTRWHIHLANACRSDARRCGYTCDIDENYILSLWESQSGLCHWLAIPMRPSVINRDPRRPSIDKLDPSKGYTRGNVVLTCIFANMGRNNFPADSFAEFVKELRAQMPR